ncbi:HAD-IA family hydrolase [Marinobacter sp. TBZ242]|jgi:phosphoglycolate phosphatase|uniref:HAD-IA family hydrolase n=1 Tax=Marinobacter azerbaijanicus TaxID=3050455 RepID=A0ABT7IHW8_9GAMM|nr:MULTISPECIES: HAD-IA family hydrolase [Marinobacter]MBL3558953.1 HAD-IA family hydrolase [Marinobacter sp. JB05H06]MDL0433275.1 HAD-IA family hydrolase [Marinobacter sp. TBZ242]|tara:strand:- start:283 stop:987 length:705 start_codon:yes stop_codon:yes gene_type:complete
MVGKLQLNGIGLGNREKTGVALFDLDGTLVDSAPDICSSVNEVMGHYGLPFVTEEYVRNWVGLGTRPLLRRVFEEFIGFRQGIDSKDDFISAYNLFLSSYSETNGKYASLYPDVRSILVRLTGWHVRIGVVTNRPVAFTGSIISQFGLDGLVDVVVCADQFGSYKPEPDMLLHALRALGGAKESSIMVGDSLSDVMAAKNAGMLSIYARYGYRSNVDECELHADCSIDSLLELV